MTSQKCVQISEVSGRVPPVDKGFLSFCSAKYDVFMFFFGVLGRGGG